jgi:hypothetical protein
MACFDHPRRKESTHRCKGETRLFSPSSRWLGFGPIADARKSWPLAAESSRTLFRDQRGSSLLEFAVVLPLLVVFVVGIYDFSAALGQRQKIDQAAQEGVIVAGAQPMSDIVATNVAPESLNPVRTAIFNSLSGSGVLPNAGASCTFPAPTPPTPPALTWIYKIHSCSSAFPLDDLVITINRGCACGSCGPACPTGPPFSVNSMVTIQYPYHWQFGKVIQLLFPGPNSYSTPTQITESATAHNQM